VAPFNNGVGGPDIASFPNPAPGTLIRDLAFANGFLYAMMTPSGSPVPSGSVVVYKLQITYGVTPALKVCSSTPTPIQNTFMFPPNGFAVLPNGNFLINQSADSCAYLSYNPTTGLVLTGITPITFGAVGCRGVDVAVGGASLYFQTNYSGMFDSITQTNLNGGNQTVSKIGPNDMNDISIINPATPPCIQAPPNLTNWYKFDTSGSLKDSSASGNNLTGTAATVPGVVLEAESFTGTAASALTASIKTQPNFGKGDFSFDSWIFIPAGKPSRSVQVLVEKRQRDKLQGWSFYLYNGRLGVQIASGGKYWNYGQPATSAAIPTNQWVLVAAVVTRTVSGGGSVQFLINPLLGAASMSSVAIAPAAKTANVNSSTPMKVGEFTISNGGFLNAQLDELELFNRALGPWEVDNIFNAGSGGKCPGSGGKCH
jgi:hypothetical protein